MESLAVILWNWVIPALILLTVLVFVHELGHYWVARRCGVRVETFSIGFGREIHGWTDRAGTRWKIGWLPLGGYVKMYGDADAASAPDDAKLGAMSPEQRRESFQHQPLLARVAIVAAGPAANFLFAILIFIALFMAVGRSFTPPVIGGVRDGSAAAEAGLLAGDRFASIDGRPVERFEEIQRIVLIGLDRPLDLVVLRDGRSIALSIAPRMVEERDRFGNAFRVPRLGIESPRMREFEPVRAPWTAAAMAVEETWNTTVAIFTAIGQMITGRRATDELGGLISIAKFSGEAAQMGWWPFVISIATMSINLGLINLLPIPVLDGGHLLFYAIEAVRRRPLGPAAQEYGLKIGLVLVVGLIVFVNWQDLWRHVLKDSAIVQAVVGLVS